MGIPSYYIWLLAISLLSWTGTAAATVKMGHYPQTESSFIDWQVIGVVDGYSLLLSDRVIESGRYDDDQNNWRQSQARKWLNDEFYSSFSLKDRQRIAGEVFLLSSEELDRFLPERAKRAAKGTAYVNSHGQIAGNNWWWLRSPGRAADYVAYVANDGAVVDSGDYVYFKVGGFRPALWLRPQHGGIETAFAAPAAGKIPYADNLARSIALIRSERYDEAISLNNRLLANSKRPEMVRYAEVVNGLAYAKMGNQNLARQCFKWAVDDYLQNMFMADLRSKDLLYQLASALDFSHTIMVGDWAILAASAGADYHNIKNNFNKLVRQYPYSEVMPYMTLLVAAACLENGDYDNAEQYLRHVADNYKGPVGQVAAARLELILK